MEQFDWLAMANFMSLAVFTGGVVWAGYTDFFSLRILNRTCLTIAAAYPLYVLTAGDPINWVGGLIVGGIMLVVGFILFATKIIGGGDAKLMAAVALWAGTGEIVRLLTVTTIFGGVLAMLWMSRLRFVLASVAPMVKTEQNGKKILKLTLPYGIAIAAGALSLLPRLIAYAG